MPIYDGYCKKCDKIFLDILAKPDQELLCDICNTLLIKEFPLPNFKLLGTGFYKNNYKWEE